MILKCSAMRMDIRGEGETSDILSVNVTKKGGLLLSFSKENGRDSEDRTTMFIELSEAGLYELEQMII